MTVRYTVALEEKIHLERRLASKQPLLPMHTLSRWGEPWMLAALVGGAEPFYVNAETGSLIASIATELTPIEIEQTLRSEMPSHTGFAFFDAAPSMSVDDDRAPIWLSAVSWMSDDDGLACVFGWTRESLTAPPPLTNELNLAGAIWDQNRKREHIPTIGAQIVRTRGLLSSNFVTPRTTAHDWLDGSLAAAEFAAALGIFAQQRLCVRRTDPVDRPLRRRLEREGWQHTPSVEVVELRAREYQGHPDDGYSRETTAPDWSCRWIVRRHWRSQWIPSEGRHRRTLVEAYVKGPPEKPLKTASKLFAVVR